MPHVQLQLPHVPLSIPPAGYKDLYFANYSVFNITCITVVRWTWIRIHDHDHCCISTVVLRFLYLQSVETHFLDRKIIMCMKFYLFYPFMFEKMYSCREKNYCDTQLHLVAVCIKTFILLNYCPFFRSCLSNNFYNKLKSRHNIQNMVTHISTLFFGYLFKRKYLKFNFTYSVTSF